MNTTRTPIGAALPFDLASVKDHMRVTHDDDDASITAMASTAAAEIEAYCDLALLDQTITTTTGTWPGQCIALPIGPVQAGTVPTVAVVEDDGTTTAVASGFWLEAGRYPVLHFPDTTPAARLRITYAAGFGDAHTALPADLSHAIADQAARFYDRRGDDDMPQGLAVAAARIAARYRRIKA